MTDLLQIKKSLLKIHPFTEVQLNQFTGRLIFSTLQKKAYLLKAGQISDGLTFINSGSIRMYTETAQGELTLFFFTENLWVTDMESLLSQQPSVNYMEALEDADLATIKLSDIHVLMDSHPCFRMLNALLANLHMSTAHLASLKTKNPDERYRELLASYPGWLNRFPQYQIASYLGITPETLSRVRARLM